MLSLRVKERRVGTSCPRGRQLAATAWALHAHPTVLILLLLILVND
ncbi:hypothetical protein CAter282_0698 [Collimonas arenae]|uniref:Uncharacterized protein n=1 Tax=Collimonas arenae TaxID=279058 RepID=A0A127PLH2_9BURK|nr:hypothetical protein CAter10_0751 [Collimonas arenae]AMP08502.1 hypothetical protein CAter282_0698 [Collimonas arenae]